MSAVLKHGSTLRTLQVRADRQPQARLTEDRFSRAPLNESQLERIGKAYAHFTTLMLDCEPESITAISDITILPRWTRLNSEQRGA